MNHKLVKRVLLLCIVATLLCGCVTVSSNSDNEVLVGNETENVNKPKKKEKKEEEPAVTIDTKVLRDDLVKRLQSDYGQISRTEFVTCLGADFQAYPDSAFGFINAVYEDFDKDTIDEVVVAVSKKTGDYSGQIEVQIYKFDGVDYKMTCSKEVSEIDFCTQQRIALFHGDNFGYGIVVDKAFWGSYTRAYGKEGQVYWVSDSADEIQEISSWEYNDIEYEDDSHIERSLKECGVPYAENCASYNNGSDKLLCTITHRNVDDYDWANLENYLTIR